MTNINYTSHIHNKILSILIKQKQLTETKWYDLVCQLLHTSTQHTQPKVYVTIKKFIAIECNFTAFVSVAAINFYFW
jgi:hypothetical protein